MRRMRIYITGNKGQLGRGLEKALSDHTLFGGDLPEIDITNLDSIRASIREARPDLVIHSAAMTDVDGCARNPDLAYLVNAIGTRNVALACQAAGCPALAISTNEVFDGTATQPYLEFDRTNPINPYAQSKHAGEVFVRDLLARFYIVRTAWLYGYGGNNFVTKIVNRARSDGQLRVVADEIGSPTFVPDLAGAIGRLITSGAYGIYHFTNDGFCSRFDFARKILERKGLADIPIEPIALADLDRPSRVPPYTPIRNFCGAQLGITLRPWPDALAEYMVNERF
jgi:dTDP-4-dehydrorhamnose reductase